MVHAGCIVVVRRRYEFVIFPGWGRRTMLAGGRRTLPVYDQVTKERDQVQGHEEFHRLPNHTHCKCSHIIYSSVFSSKQHDRNLLH